MPLLGNIKCGSFKSQINILRFLPFYIEVQLLFALLLYLVGFFASKYFFISLLKLVLDIRIQKTFKRAYDLIIVLGQLFLEVLVLFMISDACCRLSRILSLNLGALADLSDHCFNF